MQTSRHPSVSAIIPVYNGRDCVGRAIESALSQTYPTAEVIVVDDGSVDDTARIVSKYPVRYLRQPNAGPGAARNTGARAATAEWFAFLDHDDIWHPEKTERQLEMVDTPDIGVVYCALKAIDQAPMSWDHLWSRNIVGTPSGVLVRSNCFFDVDGFDVRRSLIGTEDHHLWLRIALTKWRFVRCPAAVFQYAPREVSLSSQFRRMVAAEWASCEDIASRAGLETGLVEKRRISIANHYVQEFIGKRDLAGARELIREVGMSHIRMNLLLAAFSPCWLLDARKGIRTQARSILSTFQAGLI